MAKDKVIRLMDIQEKLAANGKKDLTILHKAYVYAAQKHRGQLRQSGEPYLSHPLNVAYILAEMNMDLDTVITGILHDTIEDTDATFEEIAELFGEDVAFLVDGVSKISQIEFKSKEEKQAESFRKMLISMSKDVRVIVVKLADRLHNMRTLDCLPEEKRKRIAKETLDIYAPLAHRLGIAWIKCELEDMAFRTLNPEAYYDIYNKVKLKKSEREQFLNNTKEILEAHLLKGGIKAKVYGRAKHFYSIYNKMLTKKTTFDEIFDLLALRIMVETVQECYSALGIIHTLWKPVQGRFKDYIAMPKSNMYQSIHTTVITKGGMMVEIQIRTFEMHKIAESGIAAHWLYKEGKIFNPNEDTSFIWLRNLLEQKDLKHPQDFVDALKEDVLPIQIYVFTPNGDVIELPRGATPIDFAYSIHTEVGNKCVGAKVNGRIVPLKYKLRNGDKVEVITSSTQEPKLDWLKFVKTNRAKQRIRSYLRKKEESRAINTGITLIEKEFNENSLNFKKLVEDEANLKLILDKFSLKSLEDIYKNVGFGRISPKQVLHLFVKAEEKSVLSKPSTEKSEPLKIDGIDNVMINIAKCCNPLPGDKVKGYISRGRGIIVHKEECTNLANMTLSDDRIIDVEWDETKNFKREVKISTITVDKPGMLHEITSTMTEMGINITELSAKKFVDDKAKQNFTIEVSDKEQLHKLCVKLRGIPGVYEVKIN
jgi:GTP pyrophosphokinase